MDIKGTPRKIHLSAPKGLDLVAAARAFSGFSKNIEVENSLAKMGGNCHVEILVVYPPGKPPEAVGLSIPKKGECN